MSHQACLEAYKKDGGASTENLKLNAAFSLGRSMRIKIGNTMSDKRHT